MTCPNCGGERVSVTDTIPGFRTEVFRRRRCTDCGFVFRTVETQMSDTPEMRFRWNQAALEKRKKGVQSDV